MNDFEHERLAKERHEELMKSNKKILESLLAQEIQNKDILAALEKIEDTTLAPAERIGRNLPQ